MKCPNCDIPLMMVERKGIEIDFCSQCRGIWLDSGELDKIIEITADERAMDSIKPVGREDWRAAKSNRERQYVEERDRDKYQEEKRERYRPENRERSRDKDRLHNKDRSRSKRKKSTLARLIDFLD